MVRWESIMATAGSSGSVGRVAGALVGLVVVAAAALLFWRMAKGGDSGQATSAAGDVAAQADARGAVAAIEQCFAAGGAYPTYIAPTTGAMTGCAGLVGLSPGSVIAYFVSGGAYTFSVTNTTGTVTGKTFCYASTQGTIATIAAPLTMYRSTC
jgi:hypothetical protein